MSASGNSNSVEQEQIRSIAERIARRLSENASDARGGGHGAASSSKSDDNDLSALHSELSRLRQRLTHLESHVNHDEDCGATATARADVASRGRGEKRIAVAPTKTTPASSMWLSGTYVPAVSHPSEERFGIGEAVSELVDFFEAEKTCNVEPGGKPCDHCGMCSTRGF